MEVYVLNPLEDPRWTDLIQRDPRASVFQTREWLQALRLTYGYEPIVFTTSRPGSSLENGFVGCDVRSWLTGHRLVSLPFSDYCEPLFDSPEELRFLMRHLQDAVEQGSWSYLEVRPMNGSFREQMERAEFEFSGEYFLHRLTLGRELGEVFKKLDKDSVQRRIRRAERSGLVEERGRTEILLRHFYDLLIVTRRRHSLPPQPYQWFRNLAESFGEALEIHIAYKDKLPVASILTLRFKETVYYKYGCSDVRFNHLGATPLLLWRAISRASTLNAHQFDFGRSEIQNPGLVAFKDKWAPRSSPVTYMRFPRSFSRGSEDNLKLVKQVFALMPDKLLTITGSLIYRHIG